MKLLVIVLCLLSERFLVHATSHHRFNWFALYANAMEQRFSQLPILSSPWIMLAFAILPLFLVAVFALFFLSTWVFGFIGLLLNIIIFYYCIGPENPFYPKRESTAEKISEDDIGTYLARMNGQLFAILFWYIVTGPLMVLLYRLISLCKNQQTVSQQAIWVTNLLDWLPARMTALLYLMVGNFQAGLRYFSSLFFKMPENNQILLSACGLQALDRRGDEVTALPQAERLVEHAIIALLVLLACFTLFAWV